MPHRIGVYGGTFDPIHFGHLSTAIEMIEYHSLDKVLFCPAKINPHKEDAPTASAYHRYKMLEIALADFPQSEIVINELQRDSPSFTIDTLRELTAEDKKKGLSSQFFLIIGEDTIPHFFRWHEPKEIIKLAKLLVARRFLSERPLELSLDPEISEALSEGETPTPIMEISATRIRERIRKKQYIGHLVPAKVIDYIYQNHLYY